MMQQDYEEICCLGAGAFGVVAKARHRVTGETVAIKRHRSSDGHNGELLREARFLDACDGLPFLVGYHGLARDLATAELCLLTEYVGGPSLRDYLRGRRGRRPLPEATVRAAMWQLLTGAQRMHERRVVHRDIKPANILVGEDHRTVKICDLGLAMHASEPPPYAKVGTLSYMAPEVLLGRADYDARVDTWSLGCVMAELLAGRPLFEGRDEVEQLWAIYEVLDTTDGGHQQHDSLLRELFPEETLSLDGFEVLSGLLAFNSENRLTAAAALQLPWFDNVGALALPKEEEAVSAPPSVPRKKKPLLIIPPPLPKKPKVF
ncbi:putative cyclin-dependent kinase F-2 [Panicum virgatum]|uniref:putative cyclin-dependent kinase F-2 n=1 Tax=Panicum virgatum TaxID=38727 RepID=UPI0019D53967|nr:putative cyclin-dependent kinase F-2 [Panicum virgatum]